MEYRISMAGCGEITRHYSRAFREVRGIKLQCIYDKNENCAGRPCYPGIPFYTDYEKLAKRETADALLIATPPSQHLAVLRLMMRPGMAAIVEKPMAESMAALDEMYAMAAQNNGVLHCLFHWKASPEVMFLKKYLAGKRIRRISVEIYDDYADGATGQIRPDRLGLMGAWIDSGINALSYLQELLPMREVVLTALERRADPASGYACYEKREYRMDGIPVCLCVDWRTPSREKISVIEYEGGTLQVSHTGQSVLCDGELIFSEPAEDRLARHYENYFRYFPWHSSNEAETRRTHQILLDGEVKKQR